MNSSVHQCAVIGARLLAFLLFTSFSVHSLERLEPAGGCYFGVNTSDDDTIGRLRSRLGLSPAVYVRFFSFPLTVSSREQLKLFLDEVRPTRAIALITLEPFEGLSAVTESACRDLAQLCTTNEADGIQGIMIRFAHEMNGNWYPWCQQPLLFKEKFRLMAGIVHSNTLRTAMVWAPNNGIGYPFGTNGTYHAAASSTDFVALDTNGDGRLSSLDDMYAPYYPGDDAVDWVGMTIYHWGATYPWLENEMPPTNIFARTLRGTASQPPIPDFYGRYCNDGLHNKPLVIPETAAFFNTQRPLGPGEFQIKCAWWRQVFNAFDHNTNEVNIAEQIPKLKCINWFDHFKRESEAQNEWIDWRMSANPIIRDAFITHVSKRREDQPYFLTAEHVECSRRSNCIAGDRVPGILPLTGTLTVSLTTKAATDCDLVVDLLDETFRWYGGTRAPVSPGTRTVTLSFPIIAPLSNGQPYRWSIFLTPRGSNYLGALAWLELPRPVALSPVNLKIMSRDEGLLLSWPSIAGWRYGVFETLAVDAREWTLRTPDFTGTGGILEMSVAPNGPKKFYRLEISLP